MPTREPDPSETLAEFTWKGDTWYEIDDMCPECGNALYSNGTVHKCSGLYELTDHDCTWWELLE